MFFVDGSRATVNIAAGGLDSSLTWLLQKLICTTVLIGRIAAANIVFVMTEMSIALDRFMPKLAKTPTVSFLAMAREEVKIS